MPIGEGCAKKNKSRRLFLFLASKTRRKSNFSNEMKKILVIGAGRSSSNLIKYLLEHASSNQWIVRVGDMDLNFAEEKIGGSAHGEAFVLDGSNKEQRRLEIAAADLVVSMLPASMHVEVAKDCIAAKKHVITPSYVADEMWALDQEAKKNGVLILNEMGVDPGIDHMSAMQIIHEIKVSGGKLESFESLTGGLIAPESDNNPWNYKITWNPRNVILAGYGGTARFQKNHTLKFIPYHRLFEDIQTISVDGVGDFDGYANRDSLKYKAIYGLEDIPTLYRGTLRKQGFCEAWNALIQIGLTDDSFEIENPSALTWRDLTASFIDGGKENLESHVQSRWKLSDVVMSKLEWLGVFEEEKLAVSKGTPAVALQSLIERKWKLDAGDKDMIVMYHRFVYELEGQKHLRTSSMVCIGDDPTYTAMSKTVGLPIAIAARMILDGRMKETGVLLPIQPEIYEPVLEELATLGVKFIEKDILI